VRNFALSELSKVALMKSYGRLKYFIFLKHAILLATSPRPTEISPSKKQATRN